MVSFQFIVLCVLVLVTAHGTPLLALPALKPWVTDVECAKIPSWMKSSISNRIVGGQNAQTAIPWQVAVYPSMKTLCGGTILDSTTILCAAHCFPEECRRTCPSFDKFRPFLRRRAWTSNR